MSKRQRHSDGSSPSEMKMGACTQSEDRRERRNTSSTKEGYGPSGAAPSGCQPFAPGVTPSGCQPFTPQGPGTIRNGPLHFGPPGCFSSKPQGPGLLDSSTLRREQIIKGPGLLGVGPRGYEPLRPKGPGLLGAGPRGNELLRPKGPGPRLLEGSPNAANQGAQLEPFTTQSPSLLGAGPRGYEPLRPKGPGPRLLEGSPNAGNQGAQLEPFTTQSPSLLGAGPIGHEPFTNYSSRLPSFSPVPVQKLNNNFAKGVSPESEEFTPGLKEEPHWQSQIRELKQYVVKLENDKCQMGEQVKKMNNYIIKLQSENSRLIAMNESNNKIKNAIAGQIFKQYPHQFGKRELNLVVEKVYAKLKPQNLSPFGVMESTSMSNSYAPHSNQNQGSADSGINVFANKNVNEEDNEIQIIEPVKKESYDPYDHLDLDDIVVLLKTFKELEKGEQENLLAYIKKLEKKFPEKARILKAKYSGVM